MAPTTDVRHTRCACGGTFRRLERCLSFTHSCRVGTVVRIFENPAHWRQRAEETRVIAADLTDPMGKQMLLGVALAYDSLAVRAEQRKDLQEALINRRNDHPKK